MKFLISDVGYRGRDAFNSRAQGKCNYNHKIYFQETVNIEVEGKFRFVSLLLRAIWFPEASGARLRGSAAGKSAVALSRNAGSTSRSLAQKVTSSFTNHCTVLHNSQVNDLYSLRIAITKIEIANLKSFPWGKCVVVNSIHLHKHDFRTLVIN